MTNQVRADLTALRNFCGRSTPIRFCGSVTVSVPIDRASADKAMHWWQWMNAATGDKVE